MRDGTENTPRSPDTVVNVSPVPLFLTTMVAPGTTLPSESTTTPVIAAVDAPCASAREGESRTRRAAATNFTHRCLMPASSAGSDLQRRRAEISQLPRTNQAGFAMLAGQAVPQ